jgi:hypothetical protein
MALVVAVVTVGTDATPLLGEDHDSAPGQTLQFTTPASPVVYAGPAGVTSETGYALLPSREYAYSLGPGDAFFLAVASGTVDIPTLRTGA